MRKSVIAAAVGCRVVRSPCVVEIIGRCMSGGAEASAHRIYIYRSWGAQYITFRSQDMSIAAAMRYMCIDVTFVKSRS